MGAGLEFPENLYLFTESIFVYGGKPDEIPRGKAGRNRASINLGDYPLAAAGFDQLAGLRGGVVGDLG